MALRFNPLRAPLTWTCHCCGDERPDAAVSVHKVAVDSVLTVNVRYCNDRPACYDMAKSVREPMDMTRLRDLWSPPRETK